MTTWWPHLRAALILFHVVAITLIALPSPGGGMNRSAWKDPTVQEEFAAWTGRLQAMGWAGDQAQLEDTAWELASGFQSGRETVLTPFQPYYRYLGTWQSWKMFVAPHRYPARLHIDVDRGNGWEPLYVGRSDTHSWHHHQFDHDRFRASVFRYGWKHYGKSYRQLGAWVAKEVGAEDPDAQRIRTRFFKYKTLSPAQVRAGQEPDGSFQRARVHAVPR